MSDKYAKVFGISKYPQWNLACLMADAVDVNPGNLDGTCNVEIRDKDQIPFENLAEYEKTISPDIDRTRLLKEWLTHPHSWTKV